MTGFSPLSAPGSCRLATVTATSPNGFPKPCPTALIFSPGSIESALDKVFYAPETALETARGNARADARDRRRGAHGKTQY